MRPKRNAEVQRCVEVLHGGAVGEARLEALGVSHRVEGAVSAGDAVIHGVGVDLATRLAVWANDLVSNCEEDG